MIRIFQFIVERSAVAYSEFSTREGVNYTDTLLEKNPSYATEYN